MFPFRTPETPLIAYRLTLNKKSPQELVLLSPQRSPKKLLELAMLQG